MKTSLILLALILSSACAMTAPRRHGLPPNTLRIRCIDKVSLAERDWEGRWEDAPIIGFCDELEYVIYESSDSPRRHG